METCSIYGVMLKWRRYFNLISLIFCIWVSITWNQPVVSTTVLEPEESMPEIEEDDSSPLLGDGTDHSVQVFLRLSCTPGSFTVVADELEKVWMTTRGAGVKYILHLTPGGDAKTGKNKRKILKDVDYYEIDSSVPIDLLKLSVCCLKAYGGSWAAATRRIVDVTLRLSADYLGQENARAEFFDDLSGRCQEAATLQCVGEPTEVFDTPDAGGAAGGHEMVKIKLKSEADKIIHANLKLEEKLKLERSEDVIVFVNERRVADLNTDWTESLLPSPEDAAEGTDPGITSDRAKLMSKKSKVKKGGYVLPEDRVTAPPPPLPKRNKPTS